MCLSSMTWLPQALPADGDDDIGLDCGSDDWYSLVMSDDDAVEIHFRSFRWHYSVSFVVAVVVALSSAA